MIRLCKYNQENILDKIRNGQLDAVALSTTNLIDDIILKINSCNIFNCLENIYQISEQITQQYLIS